MSLHILIAYYWRSQLVLCFAITDTVILHCVLYWWVGWLIRHSNDLDQRCRRSA